MSILYQLMCFGLVQKSLEKYGWIGTQMGICVPCSYPGEMVFQPVQKHYHLFLVVMLLKTSQDCSRGLGITVQNQRIALCVGCT